MKFTFKKLGAVDNGDIELGDITIICGPNHAGKTYINYTIFSLLKLFHNLSDFFISDTLMEQLTSEGIIELDIKKIEKNLDKTLKNISKEFTSLLPSIFNVQEELLKKTTVSIKTISAIDNNKLEIKGKVYHGEKIILTITKRKESNKIVILLMSEGKKDFPTFILKDLINRNLSQAIFRKNIYRPFAVTSERTGISLFYKELDITTNRMLELLTKYLKGKKNIKLDPLFLIEKTKSRYALPIQENINTIRDFENIIKQKSYLKKDKNKYKFVFNAMKKLTKGSFKYYKDNLFFSPDKERNREKVFVPIYIASSASKSLFLIDLYINYIAKKNDILIIDEPELNLHPDNQIYMARLLIRLVNAGVKLLISTHSDFLLREINNLIMLSNDFENKDQILKKYKLTKEDILFPDQVKAYVMEKHSIEPLDVTKYGINLKIFDSIINKANIIGDDIYYSINNDIDYE